jgi:mRNA interferase YafQ
MRTIEYTNRFKRDYRREKAGRSRQYAQKLDAALMDVVRLLAADAAVPPRNSDHALRSAGNGAIAETATSGPT